MDDVSGSVLNSKLVREARADEVRGVCHHKVFDKVPIAECYIETGQAPVSTKWVDINKGDASNPDYRSRWVGREFKGGDNHRDDLYAATPPLEGKKALIALASCQRGVPRNKIKKLGFVDIRKNIFSC